MILFDGIEKLINEHGSSVILKERIELANEKFAILEQKLSVSEIRAHQLEAENKLLKIDNEQLKIQIKNLQDQIHNSNLLTLKYGVYWDKDGNPYCPKCKTPISQIAWATHINRQIQGLKCTCSPKAFVLIENGEPIHAPDAMRRLAGG